MPLARWRTTLAGAAVLVAVAPALVSWTAPTVSSEARTTPLPCGGASAALPWQETVVPAFPNPDGLTVTDRIANYSVQSRSPARQVVTNGVTVQASTTNGCRWETTFSLEAAPGPGGISGSTSRITTPLLLTGGRGLLAIREGNGPASRPRVLGSNDGTGGSWAPSEAGLPAQGSPGVLVASDDGRTVFLTISPTGATGGDDGGTGVPTLPPVGGNPVTDAAGLVYRSTDSGRTWSNRAGADELPGAVTSLVVDRGDPQKVLAVANGQLLRSTDGADTFSAVSGVSGVRLVLALRAGQTAAFTDSQVLFSSDHFASSRRTGVQGGITSAAHRAGDDFVAVESGGSVVLVDPRTGATRLANPDKPPRAGTLSGDQGRDSTFHAIAQHSLIRYVDPIPPGTVPDEDIIPEGSLRPLPPKPGTLSPKATRLSLPQGDSRTVDYELTLPKNPTPLDVMFLVDVSPTMSGYIEDLQQNITKISNSLVRQKIDVQTGVAFLTTGPRTGDQPYPEADPTANRPGDPYERPEVFKLLRKIGPPDAQFSTAVNRLATREVPSTAYINKPNNFDPAEAQVLALDQLMTGAGVSLVQSRGALTVAPGQSAGWRQDRFVRKVIVHATDQAFINNTGEWPAGSPEVNGELDIDGTTKRLKEAGILHLGIDPSDRYAKADLTRVSQGTSTFAPPGGAVCDPESNATVPAGQPLVCGQAADFGDALISVLRSLVDLQDVTLRTTTGSNAVSNVSAAKLKQVNVSKDNVLRFSVTYSCATIPPGNYLTTLETRLRGSKIAASVTNLECVKSLAAVVRPLPPEVEPPVAPPPQPVQPALPPPAPPAPAAQPQVQPQVQVQVQVNPMTAAMLEQQEQIQLALALNGTERPADETEYAMVDRQSREETGAQILLLASMSAASIAGVRRLRTTRAQDVVRQKR